MFGNKNISVKKIDNGFVVEAYCDGEQQVEYAKKLSKVGSILKRWFGESNKSQEDYDAMKREVTEAKGEGNSVKLKIKMTNN